MPTDDGSNAHGQPWQVPPKDAVATYLYLRVGLIGATVLLAVSIGYEIIAVTVGEGFCLQPSISAYYYTPVRAILVGGLIAVGVSLIVIKGRGGDPLWLHEDMWLNLAGMMAPVVALVPTVNTGSCWSIAPEPLPTVSTGDGVVLADWVARIVENNMTALLLTGLAAAIAAALLLNTGTGLRRIMGGNVSRVALGVVFAVIAGFGVWFVFFRQSFFDFAHPLTAVAMFIFLFAAAVSSAIRAEGAARKVYWGVASGMAVTAIVVLLFALTTEWQHAVFALEAIEIALFAIYWSAQTFEHWPKSAV